MHDGQVITLSPILSAHNAAAANQTGLWRKRENDNSLADGFRKIECSGLFMLPVLNELTLAHQSNVSSHETVELCMLNSSTGRCWNSPMSLGRCNLRAKLLTIVVDAILVWPPLESDDALRPYPNMANSLALRLAQGSAYRSATVFMRWPAERFGQRLANNY